MAVDNVQPVVTVTPPVPTPLPNHGNWVLTEDDTLANSTLPGSVIESAHEEGYGLTYQLKISLTGYEAGLVDLSSLPNYNYDSAHGIITVEPNGSHGGVLTFFEKTGQITWTTTNADVTYDASGNPEIPYLFQVTANDGNTNHGASSGYTGDQTYLSSPPVEFTVEVLNTATTVSAETSGHPHLPDVTVDIAPTGGSSVNPVLHVDAYAADQDTDTPGSRAAHPYFDLMVSTLANPDPNHPGDFVSLASFNSRATGCTQLTLTDATNGIIDWAPNINDLGTQITILVIHHDEHGSTAHDDFKVSVQQATLIEDHQAQIDIYTGAESQGLVDHYALYVDPTGTGTNYQPLSSYAGGKINDDGGSIVLTDAHSGLITWTPTNADVTLGGATTATATTVERNAYLFKAEAYDASNTLLETKTFTVGVKNDPTNVGATLDANGNVVATLGAKSITEDGGLQTIVDVASRDEQVEASDPAYFKDSYYQLLVQKVGDPTVHTVVPLDPAAGTEFWSYTPNAGGGEILISKDTGVITWEGPSGDLTHGPNNADVGVYHFTVIHHDGHGSSATDTFDVTVSDTAPSLGNVPITWKLTEDSSSSLDFTSEDEGLGNTTYIVQVKDPNDATGNTWHTLDKNNTSWQPEGTQGGILTLDAAHGILTWKPTNADVTNAIDGSSLSGLAQYDFKVQVDDGHGMVTGPTPFKVEVDNAPTEITPEAGQDSSHPIKDRTWNEDSTYSIDVGKPGTGVTDEQVEAPTASPVFKDTWYQLTVDGTQQVVTSYAWNTPDYYLTLSTGSVVHLNKDTGVLDWTPNNMDVGSHTFEVTHYDGHGSQATADFTINVSNIPPTITAPVNHLVEDSTNTAYTTLDIYSDDEAKGGVTYQVWIKDPTGSSYIALPTDSSVIYQPNGSNGGAIWYDQHTGIITWNTTNADVTRDITGNVISGLSDYTFEVVATDTHGGTSAPTYFHPQVWNDPTQVSLTVGATVIHNNDTVAANEDGKFDWNFQAKDESVDSSPQRGPSPDGVTFYDLYVTKQGGSEQLWSAPMTPNTNGETIYFDAKTGEVTWGDATDHTRGPNNADVGNYTFRVVHHDGYGSTDSMSVNLAVDDTAPSLGNVPATWKLTEDSSSSLDFTSEDEGLGNTTYIVQVKDPNDATGNTWHTLDKNNTSWQPEGTQGGILTLDAAHGILTWKPTNADVTNAIDGSSLSGLAQYDFKVQVDDGHGMVTGPTPFKVEVDNAPTEITPEAGQDSSHPIKDRTWNEDSTYSIDVGKPGTGVTDEQVEAPTASPVFKDTWYQLTVDGTQQVVTSYAWNTPDYYLTLSTGSVVHLNKDTGVLDWTPNNMDVGSHTFEVTHYDGHGSQATADFTINVSNIPPTITAPVNHLVEDSTNTAYTTLDIYSDDEAKGGVTYQVWIKDPTGSSYIALPTDSSVIYQPNGSNGGAIWYDQHTGIITWNTTNADVTRDITGNVISGLSDYTFEVVATDTHGGTSAPTYFHPQVWNDPTQVSLTVGATVIHNNDTVAANEDGKFDWNFQAKDESVDSSPQRGPSPDGVTFYDLYVTKQGGSEQLWSAPMTPNTNGETIYFDAKTGEVTWGDATDHTRGPNNADVGNYTFRVVHHDGYGSTDSMSVNLAVDDTAPSLGNVPATWKLTEDSSSSLDFTSEDEGLGNTTYIVQVKDPNDATGNTWHTLDKNNTSWQPEGTQGGILTLDAAHGILTWKPTNADVTNAIDGSSLSGLAQYDFKVQVDDGHGMVTGPTPFKVEVDNAPTEITPEAGQDSSHPIKDRTWNEDSTYSIDVGKPGTGVTDEQVEAPTASPVFKDTWYQLTVDGTQQVVTSYAWNTPDYYLTLSTGSVVHLNKDTGVLDWTPNNMDVGSHTFEVTHYDGHGSQATADFTINVSNIPPTITAPVNHLVEDSTNTAYTTLDIYSDDEAKGGVTYQVWIKDPTGSSYIALPTDSSVIYQPNGSNGGAIWYDQHTGIITWNTTNADVTRDITGNVISGLSDYTFEVVATDTHGGTSAPTYFHPQVWNDPTQVSLTVGATVIHNNDTVAANEDGKFDWNFQAKDESVDSSPQRGPSPDGVTFYDLYVTKQGGSEQLWSAPMTPNTNGETIYFDAKTGEVTWGDATDHTRGPNNADVGNYTFRVVHHDGYGSTDSMSVNLAVDDTAPSLGNVPATWKLTEDSSSSLDFTSEDEGLGNTTYIVQVKDPNDATGNTWHTLDKNNTSWQPEGTQGGILTLDAAHGILTWKPTNADVTNAIDGSSLSGLAQYDFKVQVDDGHGMVTGPTPFKVEVDNTPTEITPEAGQDSSHPIKDRTWNEDSTYSIDVGKPGTGVTDEQVEAPTASPVFKDTWYQLTVDGTQQVVTSYAWNTPDYYLTLSTGSVVHLNKDTGVLDWTPNNMDVGSHTFEVTHYDGHGSQATADFTINVSNIPPTLTSVPGPQTATEDHAYHLDVNTDDEITPVAPSTDTKVTYDLQIDVTGTGLHYVDFNSLNYPDGKINGDHGGVIVFDANKGTVDWTPTNADTTLNADQLTQDRPQVHVQSDGHRPSWNG